MLYVANWKMNKSFSAAMSFAQKYKNELSQLSNEKNSIVVCPSYPALFPLAQLFSDTTISVGAQNCSAHEAGAYTGQVSAQSLKQAGCTYCIIGHSEQRAYCHLTDQEISEKLKLLLANNIIPIICIGESEQTYKEKKTFEVLSTQLELLLPQLGTSASVIAYEPVWAIGTGIVPENSYLKTIFSWLKQKKIAHCQLLYGGSVNEKNRDQLLQIEAIEGFLIGGASLDFQKLQKIVSLS